jgi:hypothetical protein
MAEEESEEETMTEEQQSVYFSLFRGIQPELMDKTRPPAQMALSLSIAKPLLADLRPPISDAQIQESLWYYYFDVDKTVAYLKRERAKGE